MIVRVFSETQYEIDDGERERLEELDDDVQSAADSGDEARFRAAYCALLDHVRSVGTPLADDDLRTSELMLPPPDVSLAEVRRDLTGQGLIPE